MSEIISLWAFSCNLYQKPGVQSHCLWLQDKHQVDVPVLLFCCWAGYTKGSLDSLQAQSVNVQANLWREQCIAPLRATRRAMKPYLSQTTDKAVPLDREAWSLVRDQIKAAELAGEKALLSSLETLLIGEKQTIDFEVSLNKEAILCALNNIRACCYERSASLWADAQAVVVLSDIFYVLAPQMEYDDLTQIVANSLVQST